MLQVTFISLIVKIIKFEGWVCILYSFLCRFNTTYTFLLTRIYAYILTQCQLQFHNITYMYVLISYVYVHAIGIYKHIYIYMQVLTNGDIFTFAGTSSATSSADGLAATSTYLSFPQGVAVDSIGQCIYC